MAFLDEETEEDVTASSIAIASEEQMGGSTMTHPITPQSRPISPMAAPSAPPIPHQERQGLVLSFKIGEDAQAHIEFTGHVTQEAVQKLIKLLDVSLDTFPVKAVPSATSDVVVPPQSLMSPESPSALLTDEAQHLAEKNGVTVTPNQVIEDLQDKVRS